MTRLQYVWIAISVALLGFLYFGVSHKPPKLDQIERTRVLSSELLDMGTRIKSVKEELNAEQSSLLLVLEQEYELANNDSAKIRLLKELSSIWYDFGQPDIAGYYAKEAATLENTPDAWSIAGSTFVLASRQMDEERVKEYCHQQSIQCFENAISLEPDNLQHRINLALRYVDRPPEDNPMQGVLMLRDLNEKHPEDVRIIQQLARLAIQTGQFERAVQRLEKALQLDPDNKKSNCLMADALRQLGRPATEYIEKCSSE